VPIAFDFDFGGLLLPFYVTVAIGPVFKSVYFSNAPYDEESLKC